MQLPNTVFVLFRAAQPARTSWGWMKNAIKCFVLVFFLHVFSYKDQKEDACFQS